MSTPRPPRSQQTEPVLSHLREINDGLFDDPVFVEQAPPPPSSPLSSLMEQGPRITEVTKEPVPPRQLSPAQAPRRDATRPPERIRPAFDLIADAQPITEQQVRENSRREFARRRRPRVLLASLTIILVALSTAFLWRHLRTQAAITKAKEALAAMEAGEWSQAGPLLAAAQVAADQPEVIRSTVHWEWAAGAQPQQIIQLLEPLVTQRQATDADFLQLARAELLLSRPTAAQSWLDRLSDTSKSQTEAVELETRILQAAGQEQTAETRLRSHLEALPDSPAARFKLAILDYSQITGTLRQRGRSHLLETAQQTGENALTALRVLASDLQLTQGEIQTLLERAAQHPQAVETRFRYLSRLLPLLAPVEAQKRIEQEIRTAGALDAPGRLACVNAIASAFSPADVLPIVQAALIQKDLPLRVELLHLQLETLAQLGRWTEIRDLLHGPALSLDRIPLALWEACVAAALEPGKPEAIRTPLQTAIESASRASDPADLIRCADTALRLRQLDLAASLYERAAQNHRLLPHIQLLHLEKSLAILRQHTPRLESLLPLARRVAAHPAAREQQHFEADYLHLLSNQPPDDVNTRLSHLPDTTDPALLIRRQLLRSLIYLKKGQDAAFSRELRLMELDHIRLLPGPPRATLAGLLAKHGDKEHAAQLASKVIETSLIEEEKAWLAKVRR